MKREEKKIESLVRNTEVLTGCDVCDTQVVSQHKHNLKRFQSHHLIFVKAGPRHSKPKLATAKMRSNRMFERLISASNDEGGCTHD